MLSPLATSVCFVPFMFSHLLLPLVTSPGILPPLLAFSLLSPHLFLVMSLVSVYLVSVFPSLLVWSLFAFCLWLLLLLLLLLLPVWYVLDFFGISYSMFDLNFDFDLNFVFLLWYFVSSFVATLSFVPICLLLVFVISFLIKARLLFPWSCLLCNCVWVHLPFHSLPFLPQPDRQTCDELVICVYNYNV